MRTSRIVVIAAAAVVVVAALVVGGVYLAAPHNRSFTSADLSSILKKEQSALGISGVVEAASATQISSAQYASPAGDVSDLLGSGATLKPAACKALVLMLPLTSTQFAHPVKVNESAMLASNVSVKVAAPVSGAMPASAWSTFSANVAKVVKTCGSMTLNLSGGALSQTVTITESTVKTKADHTIALHEVVASNGQPVVDNWILQSVKGNLYVNVSEVAQGKLATVVKYTNATLTAAEKLH